MEFVSEEEYEEYIKEEKYKDNPEDKPIEIIKKYFVEYKKLHFKIKVVLYKRKIDNLFFVYGVSQYFDHKPNKEVYTFEKYSEAFNKYKLLGGR